MKRLSKTNPGLYKLLKSDNLIQAEDGQAVNNDDFADDDRDIAYWEKKLGLNKKKTKTLGKEFEEDGLLDILGNIEGEENDDDQEYLRKKRQRQAEQKKKSNKEEKAEEAVDDIFAGFESEEEDEDENEEEEDLDMMEEDSDEEAMIAEEEYDSEDSDAEIIDEDDIDSDEEALNEESDESEEEEEKVEEQPKSSVLSKYVPPHLRKTAVTKSEQQMKLHKQLQGQLNRLSESNMESILLEIEKCYGTYPRHGNNLYSNRFQLDKL
jgi:nucleolar MIF4G domain-containing protein 1